MPELLEKLPDAQRDWLIRRADAEGRDVESVLLEVISTGMRRIDFMDARRTVHGSSRELNRRLA